MPYTGRSRLPLVAASIYSNRPTGFPGGNRSTIPRTCLRQDDISISNYKIAFLWPFGLCQLFSFRPISADFLTILHVHRNSLSSMQSSILYLTPSISLCQD